MSVVIPFRSDCQFRQAALDYIRIRHAVQGRATLISDFKPWSKPAAINRAAQLIINDVLIVNDAECWSEGLDEAIAAVEAGAAWAVPHHHVYRFTRESTAAIIAGKRDPFDLPTLEAPYKGTAGGGVFVVRRGVLLDIPWDERFTGWGREDCAWRDAMRCLVGMEWRGKGRLAHLWHPPAPDARRISPENAELYARYRAARKRPEAMRDLLHGHA